MKHSQLQSFLFYSLLPSGSSTSIPHTNTQFLFNLACQTELYLTFSFTASSEFCYLPTYLPDTHTGKVHCAVEFFEGTGSSMEKKGNSSSSYCVYLYVMGGYNSKYQASHQADKLITSGFMLNYRMARAMMQPQAPKTLNHRWLNSGNHTYKLPHCSTFVTKLSLPVPLLQSIHPSIYLSL